MSILSVTDFITIPTYAWKVYRACKGSSEEFISVAAEVASLHIVLKETEEYVSEHGANLGPDREARLVILGKGCREALQNLESLLLRYESLGTHSQRTWDRMRWGSEDISAARQRLSTNTALLASFNLSLVNSSQARIEAKLDKLVAEIRAGKRNSSVVSSRTIESLSKCDQATWRQLRKELEDMGISAAVLNEHRQFITSWLKKAIESRALEEERPKEWENEAPDRPSSVMAEQGALSWSPLSRGLTSPTLVPVEDAPQSAMEKGVGGIMGQLHYRTQSILSNRPNDGPTLQARVGSFFSRLPLFDNQPRRGKERARNEEIEKQLEKERSMQRFEIKILLLGKRNPLPFLPRTQQKSNSHSDDNEPGNSTLLKQLKLQYLGGYSLDQQESFISIILSNILQSMKSMLKETGISLDGTNLEPYSRAIQLLQPRGNPNESIPSAARTAIRMLWGNLELQRTLRQSNEYKHNRAARHYLNSIDRITAPAYRPTDKDILHARAKTTGVSEQRFDMQAVTYRIFDTVYPEKRQLAQYFEQVTAIIFSVDLADSDRLVDQSTGTCLLQEDMLQFDAVCNSRCFRRTPVILYLNNTDYFYDKLNVPPLSTQFPDYEGGSDNLAALHYIRNRFQRLSQSSTREIYTHLSPSMDTSQLRTIEKTVNNIIIQTNVDNILR